MSLLSDLAGGKILPVESFLAGLDSTTSKCVSEKRPDGRKPSTCRPLFLKSSVIANAKGSVYCEQGNTKVVCGVFGPHEIAIGEASADINFLGQLEFNVTFLPFATKSRQERPRKNQPTEKELEFNRILLDAFKPVVCLTKFPKAQVDVNISIIEDDGGVISACLTATSVALADAGIDMFDLLIGCNMRLAGKLILLDPVASEEYTPSTSGPGENDEQTFMNHGSLCIGLMPSIGQLSTILQSGQIEKQVLLDAMKLLTDCCYQTHTIVQQCIVNAVKEKLQKQQEKS